MKKELYYNKFGFVIEPKAKNHNSQVLSILWIVKMPDQDPICFSKYQKGTKNRKKTETKEQKASNLPHA